MSTLSRVARWFPIRVISAKDLDALRSRVIVAKLDKDRAQRDTREARRFLVLLREPLKDWDLADFPGIPGETPEAHRHLLAIQHAYRMSAGKVAPICADQVASDQALGRGWGDLPLTATAEELEKADRAIQGRRTLP